MEKKRTGSAAQKMCKHIRLYYWNPAEFKGECPVKQDLSGYGNRSLHGPEIKLWETGQQISFYSHQDI
jgi:hypothetical protein